MNVTIPQVRHNCAYCAGPLAGRRKFFCSAECAVAARAGYLSVRSSVMARDNWTCDCCGRRGGRLEVHHICPLYARGTNDVTNLITVCAECHDRIHSMYTFAELQAVRRNETTINYSEVYEDAIMSIRLSPKRSQRVAA